MNRKILKFAILLISVTIFSCDRDEIDDTLEPKNQSPVIDSITIPDLVEGGQAIQLSVIAHDDDGDQLSFRWSVTAGDLIDPKKSIATWISPRENVGVQISVSVSDGFNEPIFDGNRVEVIFRNFIYLSGLTDL